MSELGPVDRSWRMLAPPDAALVRLSGSAARRRAQQRRIHALPAGTPVVLLDLRPGSRGRCRRFTARAGVQAGHEYIPLPSLRRQLLLVEDAREPLRYALQSLLAVPPGMRRLAGPAAAVVAFARAPAAWRAVGSLAPGRIVVGRRA
jgi:hypothetical protein